MKLLLDIGNSRLKWGVEQAGVFLFKAAVDYRQAGFFEQLQCDWQALETPTVLLLASVAQPAVKASVIELAGRLWPVLEIRIAVASAFAGGVRNAYAQPERLGVDRWLALLAVHRFYPGHSCIVDCGTAITLDVIAADGRHLGGLICPGLQAMKKTLAVNTAALGFNAEQQPLGLADNTLAAIDSGTLFAAVGMIETVRRQLDQPCQLLLCGGDAPVIAGCLQQPFIVDGELVFKGLSIL